MLIIGIVSLYANPLHLGHIHYINAAKHQSELLIAIINNDKQVDLKGSIKFMDQNHRLAIVQNLKAIDKVLLSTSSDTTVCKDLSLIKEQFPLAHITFYNSGDRKDGNIKEIETCDRLIIHRAFLDLPKIYSSSELKCNPKT